MSDQVSKTRRWVGIENSTTYRVPFRGLLHSLLLKLSIPRTRKRYVDLRHNEMHAFELQQALVFGLMCKYKGRGRGYRITPAGKRALRVFESNNNVPNKFCPSCKLRVSCLPSQICLGRHKIEIPIKPSWKWIAYFNTKVW